MGALNSVLRDEVFNTNQYKDVIAQREFSASEARSFIAPWF